MASRQGSNPCYNQFGIPGMRQMVLEDRFGIALIGTSGRGLKTEALKHALAVYGNGFMRENHYFDGAKVRLEQQYN